MKRLFITLLFGLFWAGCNSILDEKTPPIGTFKAFVEGEIHRSNGEAVSHTAVKILSHEAGCEDQAVSQGVETTDQDGRFHKQIEDVVSVTIRCVTLEISSNSARDTTLIYETNLPLQKNEPFEKETIHVELR